MSNNEKYKSLHNKFVVILIGDIKDVFKISQFILYSGDVSLVVKKGNRHLKHKCNIDDIREASIDEVRKGKRYDN